MRKLITILIANVVITSFTNVFGLVRFNKQQDDTLNYSGQVEYNYCFTEATKHKIFGNYNQAINLFLKCIKIKQNSGAVYYQLSDIYYLIGEKKRALSFARTAYKFDRKNVWYQINLAQMYQFNDKIDSTIYIYKKIVRNNPKYEYQFNLAFLYLKVNQFKKTIRILNHLERNYGLTKEIIFSLYRAYTFQNDNKSAIKVLKEGIKTYPGESRLYGLLAEHYASIRENELAFLCYNQLLDIDPENEKGILSLLEFYKTKGNYDKAIELAETFICNDNVSKDCKKEMLISLLNDQRNYVHFQMAIKTLIENLISTYSDDLALYSLYVDYFIKTNNLERAKDELLLMVNTFKDNYSIWERLFYVLSSLNEYKLIFNRTNEALSYFKEKPLLYLFKGIAAYQLREYSIALNTLNAGVKYIRDSKILELQFYTFLGEIYNAKKDFDSSDYYFEKALEIDKTNIYVLNNYSYYLALRREKLNLAEEYIKRCLEIEPRNYNYLDTYSWILFSAGKVEEAKGKIEQSILNGGSASSDVLEHYAEILVKLKLNEEAFKCYRLIKDLGKESCLIRSLLKISD